MQLPWPWYLSSDLVARVEAEARRRGVEADCVVAGWLAAALPAEAEEAARRLVTRQDQR
jgi:hypothetical protein